MRSFYRAAVISSCFIAHLCALEIDSDFADASVPEHTLSSSEQSITLNLSDAEANKNISCSHWYFRVREMDSKRPLVLRIKENNSTRVYYTNGLTEKWRVLDLKKDAELFSAQIALKGTSLFLANQPPLGLASFYSWIEAQREKHAYVDKVTNITTTSGEWVPVLRISEGDKVEARRLAIIVDAESTLNSNTARWCLMGIAKWTVGEELDATWLRQNCEIVILPASPSGIANVLKSMHTDQRDYVQLRLSRADADKAPLSDSMMKIMSEDSRSPSKMISIPLLSPDDESDFISFYQKFGESAIKELTLHLQRDIH